MQPITLLIADQHAHYRRSLRQLCEVNGDFRVLAEAESSRQAISLNRQLQPQVVLLDWNLTDLSGPETARAITAEMPQTAVILLAFFCHETQKNVARQARAADCLAKDCDAGVLFAAIHKAAVTTQAQT